MGQTSSGCAAEFGEGKNIIDVRHQHRYFTWNGIIGKEFLHHVFDGLVGAMSGGAKESYGNLPGRTSSALQYFPPPDEFGNWENGEHQSFKRARKNRAQLRSKKI